MIYIQKSKEPEEIIRWKKKFKNKNKRNPQYEDIRQEKEMDLLKDALWKEQKQLCCYCCSHIQKIDDKGEQQQSGFHIEHFRPKGREEYKELSLTYENLHASCNGKNNSRCHCGHKKKNEFNEKLMISPLSRDCETHFKYMQDGTIMPVDEKDEKAKYTIETLNLQDKKLCSAREKAIWTFGVFEMSEEQKREWLQKYENSDIEELPTHWDAIKYFLKLGD